MGKGGGSDESQKEGCAPTEGLVSALWTQGKAVHHHGHYGISIQLPGAIAWPAPSIPPPSSSPPSPGVGRFHLELTIGLGCLWGLCGLLLSCNLSHPTPAPFSSPAFVRKMGQSPRALWGGWAREGLLLPIDLRCFCQLPERVCRTPWGCVWLRIMK